MMTNKELQILNTYASSSNRATIRAISAQLPYMTLDQAEDAMSVIAKLSENEDTLMTRIKKYLTETVQEMAKLAGGQALYLGVRMPGVVWA